MNLLLKQERTRRGWSRATVEAHTGIPQRSLENWEEGGIYPRSHNIDALCKLYGKTAEELGFDKAHDIMGATLTVYAPQEEENPMPDPIRRHMFSNLGSRLTSLVDTWPHRNYHYKELQEEINKAIFDHHVLAQTDGTAEIGRREALKSMALVPVQLVGGIAIIRAGKQKTDTDLLLKYIAAGITACWYLRRGRDLAFVSDLTSFYISILTPLVNSHSEAHKKASAELLSQNFRLKGSITEHLKNSDQAIPYYNEAIGYALMAGNISEQAIVNRMMAFAYWRQGTQGYELALPYAEKANELAMRNKGEHRNIQSFCASGLSLCQAVNGHAEDAKLGLTEAHNLFDPTMPVPSMYYTESNLLAISADVYQHRNHWQEAVDLWEKSLSTPDISALGSVQARINYAKTEVSRDDQGRNMDLCIKLLTEAITGAEELKSLHYQQEAREVYNLLKIAWPREDAIKKLGRDHFGTK